jgi:ABC-type phosphate transport system substrate-binding protein
MNKKNILLAATALSSSTTHALAAGTTLNGSGSTLSKPYQEVAIEEFKKGNKEADLATIFSNPADERTESYITGRFG